MDNQGFGGHVLVSDDVFARTGVATDGNRADSNQVEEEAHRLPAWHDTRRAYRWDVCVPQLVAARAAARPDAVALVAPEGTLNYRELNQRANRLAHHLRTLGVGPEVLVSVCLERSLDMIVAFLGILKAGGAYLPLDPVYPQERLLFMLEDSRSPVLVTRHDLSVRVHTEEVHHVCIDSDDAVLAQYSTTEPPAVEPDALAYVIYTSGSTGRPKGVEITHKSLLNLVFWRQEAFGISPADRATQMASPAFDAAVLELWPQLTAGASIYLPDEETRRRPELLRDWLVAHQITMTFQATRLAEELLALDWPRTAALRALHTGGDMLHHYPAPGLPFMLINNYGPTECTVEVTSGPVPPTVNPSTSPSIGRPIANTEIYILTDDLQQVPIGAPGELYIGGIGVGRGYRNRPDLTAQRFVPHPFSTQKGTCLYRTGDLVRYLKDGQLAFLGRSDDQIKLLGYRIEPGEIAAVLHRHPAVQKSLVVARDATQDNTQLVAYILAVPGASVTAGELRAFLAAQLPSYMIPATFVALETLPLTPSGKIDRAALPSPNLHNTLREEPVVAPRTAVEERLAGIIAPLLGREQISLDDNFFLLGGHSLLGAQLIARIAETFGVELTLRSLFEASTVRQLAAETERMIVAQVEAMNEDEIQSLLA